MHLTTESLDPVIVIVAGEMGFTSRAVTVVLTFASFGFAFPRQNDFSRRTEGGTFDAQAAEAADIAWQSAAIETAFDNMFSDETAFPPPVGASSRKAQLNERAERVKGAFMHSWNGYKSQGLPQDEVKPMSGSPYSTR